MSPDKIRSTEKAGRVSRGFDVDVTPGCFGNRDTEDSSWNSFLRDSSSKERIIMLQRYRDHNINHKALTLAA